MRSRLQLLIGILVIVVLVGIAGLMPVRTDLAQGFVVTDSSGRAIVVGPGTIGTPAGGVLSVVVPNTAGTTDPCSNPAVLKSSAFATITTATTTALVAVSGAKITYVCFASAEISGTTSAGTVLFEDGTGVACAAATDQLTPIWTDAATAITDLYFTIGGGNATAFSTAASKGLCAVTTIGTAPSIPVFVTFVQQ